MRSLGNADRCALSEVGFLLLTVLVIMSREQNCK